MREQPKTKKVLDKKIHKEIIKTNKTSAMEKPEDIKKLAIIKMGFENHLDRISKRLVEIDLLGASTFNKDIQEEKEELIKERGVVERQIKKMEETFPKAFELSDHIFQSKIREIRNNKGADYAVTQEEVNNARKEAEEEVTALETKEEGASEEKIEKGEDTEAKINNVEEKPEAPQISPEQIKTLEQIIKDAETKQASKLESSKFKNGVIKGLDKWENYGKGEEGVKGFAKRFSKMAINLALIGAISSVSVQKLAEAGIGTATALGGGVTSYVGKKLAIGLGLGAAMEVGGKKIPPSIQKWMPAIMGGVGVAVAVSGGALATGAAVGASAFVGWLAQKYIKGKFTNEKIGDRQEEAKQKLLQKYEGADGNINLNKLAEIEEEYVKILKKFENQKIWGKLLDGAMKLGVGSLVSGLSLEAMGTIKDFTTNDHLVEAKHETNIQHEKHIPVNHETEIFKPATVSFSSHGAISTINEMKAEIHHQYPDITKAPASMQEFVNSDSVKEAIKLGLYDPNDAAESSMLHRDSILGFDQRGDLYIRDSHTGQAEFLMQSKYGVETITKFDGKMFDSDRPVIRTENINTENHPIAPGENISPEPANPIETTEPITGEHPITGTEPVVVEHPTTPTEIPNANPTITEHTPTPTAPEVKLVDFKFDNPNHVLPITENGNTIEIKFEYDANHHITGTDVGSSNYHVNTESYIDQVKLHELDGFSQSDASRDIYQMAKEAMFLEKLPHNTAEYQYLHNHVAEMQKNIISSYGNIINNDKLEINSPDVHTSTESNTTIHNSTETLSPTAGVEQINTDQLTLQVSSHNIEHLFPAENNQASLYWDDVKGLNADKLYHMTEVADKFKPLLEHMHQLKEATGLEPKGPTNITAAETIGEYLKRATEVAVKDNKINDIEL